MRYFIGFLVSIGLIIFIIVLLFHGGGSPKVPKTSKSLVSYSTTATAARLTIDGPINAAQDHTTVQLTVGKDGTTYAQINGYDGSVANSQTYANSPRGYAVFLQALSHAGFTEGSTSKSMADERGYCPLGRRYIFELVNDNQVIERFWATNCGKPKTYLGNLSLTLDLFENQVPGYSQLTNGLDL